MRVLSHRASVPALDIYRPLRPRARAGARINVALARLGIGLPVAAPVPALRELARKVGLSYDGAAAFRSSAAGRFVVGLAQQGTLRYVLKIGPAQDYGLEREAAALDRLQGVHFSVRVPRLLWHGVWEEWRVVVTEALPNAAPKAMDLFEVADICTDLCRGVGDRPAVHGDLAPWNVLECGGATYVIDWEQHRPTFEPLYDLAHYIIRAGALLSQFSPRQAAELLTARNSPGWYHLEAIGIEPATAPQLVADYLRLHSASPGRLGSFQRRVFKYLP